MKRPRTTASRHARARGVIGVPASRRDAERGALDELETWRAAAIPDPAAPLDADDLVRLLRDCVRALGVDHAVVADFSVHTVHYYRRKDIIDPPEGRTAAARYGLHHVWQLAGARLAGHLGLVTLAEARSAIRGADDEALRAFLAARVVDARARADVRVERPAAPMPSDARPLPGVTKQPATMIALGDDAWCVVPVGHPAHRSRDAAEALGRALVAALRRQHTH